MRGEELRRRTTRRKEKIFIVLAIDRGEEIKCKKIRKQGVCVLDNSRYILDDGKEHRVFRTLIREQSKRQ